MESYSEKHSSCDWCGYSTRGRIEDNKVLCTSCQLPLIDNIPIHKAKETINSALTKL